MNNLFETLNGFQSNLAALKANPAQFLMQRRLNIPQDFSGGPQEIVQHLLSTGQITQEQLTRAQQIMNKIQPRM